MRNRFEVQLTLGAVPIEKLNFPTTREVTSSVMKALQWIFITPEVNQSIFTILEESIISGKGDHLVSDAAALLYTGFSNSNYENGQLVSKSSV